MGVRSNDLIVRFRLEVLLEYWVSLDFFSLISLSISLMEDDSF